VGLRLEGEVALVTGGSRGIGRASCLALAKEGAVVCVNYRKRSDRAAEVLRRIEEAGGEGFLVGADVADPRAVGEMTRKIQGKFGKIDVLVNNAGVIHSGGFRVLADSEFEDMFSVNVRGVLNCSKAVAGGMIRRRRGTIVNISSIAALATSVTGSSHYSMTKAAIVNLTKKMALELGPYSIRVNAIAPGFIGTDLNRASKTEKEFEKVVQMYKKRTILRRIGEPEEIASAVVFLASSDSSFMTGQTITIDGGRTDILSHSM
jgi:NAD(P)-dependent dehydrogenase (short-subunit alcohol dehydrogenase family)